MLRRQPTSQQNKGDAAGGRSQQQLKKPTETKKTPNDDTDDTPIGGPNSTGANQSGAASNSTTNLKDEDDIYEFKSTPKDSSTSSSDEKSDTGSTGSGAGTANSSGPASGPGKNTTDKSATDEKTTNDTTDSGAASATNPSGGGTQTKRPFSELEGADSDNANQVVPISISSSIITAADDDSKRKKRKDSDATTKEPAKGSVAGRTTITPKTGKIPGPASKTMGLMNKGAASMERKSPCASPKPPTVAAASSTNTPAKITPDSDVSETDEAKSADSFSGGAGPKVPPLKIVIPQQNSSTDHSDQGNLRNGKNASSRSHPYVVASSNSNDSSADKDSTSSRSASPEPSGGKNADDKPGKNSDERTQPRVLRSSHRTGTGGKEGSEGSTKSGQSVDRGSNNSSPQMQNISSPGTNNAADSAATNNTTNQQNSGSTSGTGSNASSGGQQQQSAKDEQDSSTTPSPATSSTSTTSNVQQPTPVELHPRKRKIKASKEQAASATSASNTNTNQSQTTSSTTTSSTSSSADEKPADSGSDGAPDQSTVTNSYQQYLNMRKQIERRRKNLFPVQPKPPQGFKDYLMNRRTYVLAGKADPPVINLPVSLPQQMKDTFLTQEKERQKLRMQHIVEKEKLVLAVEQEIVRVHGRAASALQNQLLPFSVCTILKDEEIYNMITPEQEEKDRNARSRYNGRLFLGWLQDVDDKWEKIKEAMLLRHHNESESLHAVQKMDWEWKMKEVLLCEFKAKPVIDDQHVPMVGVRDDFDLLPA